MPINESIYGSPSSWDSPTSNQFITDFKIVDYGTNQNTLQNAVALGKFNKDTPIDKSIAFMGIGKECNHSNPKYFTKENGALTVKEFAKRDVTNTALYITNDTSSYYASSYRFGDSGTGLQSDINVNWNGVDRTNNINKPVQFVADFNIKNLVMLISVTCSAAPTGSIHTYTLAEYSAHATEYPYIRRVYGELYGVNAPYIARRDKLVSGSYGNSQIAIATLDDIDYNGNKIYRYTSVSDASSRSNDITIIGSHQGLCRDLYDWLFYDCELENTSVLNNGYYYYSCLITDYNTFKEIALKAAAQFGLYFTDNITTARDGAYTDANMYIGLLDENGISHGQYAKGADTAAATQNTWNSVRDSNYDYTKDVDTTNYVNDTRFYGQFYSNSFNKKWVINADDVSNLSRELFSALNQVPEGESVQAYCQRVFLTNNPIDCIINLKKFPLTFIPAGPKQANIKLGAYTSNVIGAPLLYATDYLQFSFSNAQNNGLFPVFGDCFLDYEPYTKAEVTVPFCGTCEIPCTYLYQYGITIRLIIDFTSGACTAYIMSNGITIDTLQGNCAIDLPVTGVQSATLDSQIFANAQADNRRMNALGVSLVGGAVAMAAAVLTGGATAALIGVAGAFTGIIGSSISAAQQGAQIEYNFEHMQLPLKQVSSASPALAQSYDMRCKLRITRPKLADGYDQAVYANTIGHATCRNTSVANCTGFTVGVINVNGIAATAEEKEAIKNQFASGVYL